MPLLIEYYVVLLSYNITKIFSIKKCPGKASNFLEKSSFWGKLNHKKRVGDDLERRNFHSTTSEDGFLMYSLW